MYWACQRRTVYDICQGGYDQRTDKKVLRTRFGSKVSEKTRLPLLGQALVPDQRSAGLEAAARVGRVKVCADTAESGYDCTLHRRCRTGRANN